MSIELGYSPTAVTENGVALTTPRPYTPLTELIDPFSIFPAAAGRGLVDSNIPNTNVRWQEPLDLIVDQPDTFVVVAHWNNTALAQFWNGQLRLVENVLRSALEAFY